MSLSDVVLDRLNGGDHGRKAERKASGRLGGALTRASGALADKADIVLERFLVESKSTETRSMQIQLDWLLKVNHESLGVNKNPALLVQFVDKQGSPLPHGTWVMIKESDFAEIFKAGQ